MAGADLRGGYIELIRQLGELSPIPFAFGGYAEDALLWGRTMRDHSDVDVMVRRGDLEEWMRQFATLGFDHFDTYYELIPGKPQVLNGELTGVHLEVSILETDGERDYFVVEAGDRRFRMYMESATFSYPPSMIDGVWIQTISPLMLYLIRQSLVVTGAFGELRAHDAERQRALREILLAGGVAEDDLVPDVVEARD